LAAELFSRREAFALFLIRREVFTLFEQESAHCADGIFFPCRVRKPLKNTPLFLRFPSFQDKKRLVITGASFNL